MIDVTNSDTHTFAYRNSLRPYDSALSQDEQNNWDFMKPNSRQSCTVNSPEIYEMMKLESIYSDRDVTGNLRRKWK